MAIDITINGVAYSVPSNAADTNWAQDQVVFEQALAAAVTTNTTNAGSPTWVAITPINSWANMGGFPPAKRYKDSAGNVHLRFALNGGTSGTVAFALPTGSRPTLPAYFIAVTPQGVDLAAVEIAAGGNVTITQITGDVQADGAFLECSFSTVA